MWILRKLNKLFSTGIDDFQGEADTGIQDFIKIVAMGRKSPKDLQHWIDMVADSIVKTARNRKSDPGKIKSIQYLLYGIAPEDIKNKLKSTGKVSVNSSISDYIKKMWRKVYNQKKGEANKYSSIMSQNPKEENVAEIEDKLRYFGYRLSGQFSDQDGWTDVYLTQDPINFQKNVFDNIDPNSPGFKDKVKKEVKSIIRSLFDGEDDILKYL